MLEAFCVRRHPVWMATPMTSDAAFKSAQRWMIAQIGRSSNLIMIPSNVQAWNAMNMTRNVVKQKRSVSATHARRQLM